MAVEPTWTYLYKNGEIGDLIVSPDGSSVIAGAGKVLVFSKNGTLQATEPFGEVLAQTPDGSVIAAIYSTSVLVFGKTIDPTGNPILEKKWETSISEQLVSCSISDNGNRVAVGTFSGEVYIYEGTTGKLLGKSTESSSLIKISPSGTSIAGLSVNQGLKMYSGSNGKFYKQYDITLSELPKEFFITPNDNTFVYNDAQQVTAVSTSDGTQNWRTKATGDVNALVMTSIGDYIVAGTDSGSIDLYTITGNRSWTYQSKSGSGSGQGIEAVAVSSDASRILAGSFDGKIILLDKSGNALWTWNATGNHIWNVAIASDGSLAAAASDTTIYAFSTGGQNTRPTGAVSKSATPVQTSSSKASATSVPRTQGSAEPEKTALPEYTAISATPSVTQTEYSVIRTATQSPFHTMTTLIALLGGALVILRKKCD